MTEVGHHLLGYLKEHPLFFGKVYTFNLCPATYAHVSHWPATLSRASMEAALESPRASQRLSHWLLEKESIAGTFVEDFSEAPRQLALLDASIIQRLFLYTGAALLHERIAHVVAREARQALESQLGADIYSFAVRRASLMIGQRPELPALAESGEDLFSDVLSVAQRCFEACFSGSEMAFKARFRLKLPAALEWQWGSVSTPETAAQAWAFLKRLLSREVDPDALSCFD